MALTHEEISLLVRDCNDLFQGKIVQKVYHLPPHALFLRFYVDGQKIFLLMTTRDQVSRFHPVWTPPVFPAKPSPLAVRLRGCFCGRRLSDMVKLKNQRAVRLNFKHSPDALVGTFFGSRGNVMLLHKEKLAGSLWPVKVDGQVLTPGQPYKPGPAPPSMVTRQHPRYLFRDADEAYPVSKGIARSMDAMERTLEFRSRRDALQVQLKRGLKQKKRLLEKLEGQKADAVNAEAYRHMGEALKCAFHTLKRGMASISLPDPYAPEAMLTIPLDPGKSPLENMEKYFKRARRFKQARDLIEARYADTEEAVQGMTRDLALLADLTAETLDWAARLDAMAGRYAPKKTVRKKGPAQTPAAGARHFELRGHALWIGRNAKNNTALVRRIARGNDYFLHVAGRPGAVVIVRPPPGADVARDVLLDAAFLAVHHSCGANPGVQDVDYTQVKHVRPIRGKQGRFSLGARRCLRVTPQEDRLLLVQKQLKPM